MAGHWIKWEKGLLNKPEIIRLSAILKKSRKEVAATCMVVWEWADDMTTSGSIEDIPSACIDEMAGISGFADALEKVGWLIADKSGITFPNYDRHNGETSKKRSLEALRQMQWRRKQKEK